MSLILSAAEELLKESNAKQSDQGVIIKDLSTQFDEQHEMLDSIRAKLVSGGKLKRTVMQKFLYFLNFCFWIFALYHIFTFLYTTLYFRSSQVVVKSPKIVFYRILNDYANMQ